jgi:hypothetical protein
MNCKYECARHKILFPCTFNVRLEYFSISVPGTYSIRAMGSGSPVVKLSGRQFIISLLKGKSLLLVMLAFKNVDQQDIKAWLKLVYMWQNEIMIRNSLPSVAYKSARIKL